jgi:hypothetical protein
MVFLGEQVNNDGRRNRRYTPYLPFLHLKNTILDCVSDDNTLSKDVSHLAHPVDAIERLGFNSKRPTEVK